MNKPNSKTVKISVIMLVVALVASLVTYQLAQMIRPSISFLDISIFPSDIDIPYNTTKTFLALIHNGTAPYDVAWYSNETYLGNGTAIDFGCTSEFGFSKPFSYASLKVIVTDANNGMGMDSTLVYDSFQGAQENLPFYVGSSQPYSYVIDTNSTHSFAFNGTTGFLEAESTSTSAVLEPIIKENTTMFFKKGEYPIDSLLLVDGSSIHFTGSGMDTILLIEANSGFNISSTSYLYDIRFQDFYWLDAHRGDYPGYADYGITSAMPPLTRINGFVFTGNRVIGFRKAGTIFLNLTNAEGATISQNVMSGTETALIQLISNQYESGNNRVYNNIFALGFDTSNQDAIILKSTGGNSSYPSSSSALYSWGNQFFGAYYGANATAFAAISTGTYCTAGDVHSQNDRYESLQVYRTSSFSASASAGGGIFQGDDIYSEFPNTVMFYLDAPCRETFIKNNHIALSGGTNASMIVDLHNTGIYYNMFVDNYVDFSGTVNASAYTIVYGNININPIGYVANFRSGANTIAAYGGYDDGFANHTAATVFTTSIEINITGGTGVNITITDTGGHVQIVDATSLYWKHLEIGYKIIVTWTTEPTTKVFFN
jgi:hypothetical protein